MAMFAVISVLPAHVAAEPVSREDSRFAFSFGLIGGGNGVSYTDPGGNDHRIGGAGAGLYARGGIGLGDMYGIDVEIAGGTLLFLEYFWRVAATANATPTDWLTVAVGPVAGGFNDALDSTVYGSYLGGTVRADVHPWGTRRRVVFSVALDIGKTLSAHDGNTADSSGTNGFASAMFAAIGFSL